ncbi:hypothetical protein HL653_10270 [Sphingomonas sp. AP4-R1]|uniref:hypothetical protein n=1 Tax=Sphingomonas sp. AP4-R1 TaxID=2735134 RepID=UPI0014934CAD|nr:hypothetical protein [Sphingomonas sp. AP4-R1]QJU58130.1 hypothetical protein HL653_10270 [Sphingomonas sp. AP4-R1]
MRERSCETIGVGMEDGKIVAKKATDRRGPVTKLSEGQVREIRRLAEEQCPVCGSKPSLRNLGARFGVSAPSILSIIERRTWRHVDQEERPPVSFPGGRRLSDVAELLSRHGVTWQGEEQLRLAAEVLRAFREEEENSRQA